MSESEMRLPARTGTKRLPLRLSIAERTFLLAHIGGASLTDAYLVVRPGVPRETAGTLGPRMFRRIQRKADWPKVLDGAGLGDMRLLQELERRLNATIVRHYEGKEIGTYPDNAVRMKATELLAELNGRRKAELTIHEDVVTIIPAPRPEELPGEEGDADG